MDPFWGDTQQTNMTLSNMKRLLSIITESIPQGVLVLDSRGNLVAANTKCQEILGANQKDILGQSVFENSQLKKLQLHTIFQNLFYHKSDAGGAQFFTPKFHFHHRLNGFLMDIKPLFDTGDLSGVFVTIMHAKDAVDNLDDYDEQHTLIKCILKNSFVGYMLLDEDFNIIDINANMCNLFNIPQHKDFLGKKCYQTLFKKEYVCNTCPIKTAFLADRLINPKDEFDKSTKYANLDILTLPLSDNGKKMIAVIVNDSKISTSTQLQTKASPSLLAQAVEKVVRAERIKFEISEKPLKHNDTFVIVVNHSLQIVAEYGINSRQRETQEEICYLYKRYPELENEVVNSAIKKAIHESASSLFLLSGSEQNSKSEQISCSVMPIDFLKNKSLAMLLLREQPQKTSPMSSEISLLEKRTYFTELVNFIVHRINTPLNQMYENLAKMRSDHKSENREHYEAELSQLRDQVEKIASITSDLVSYITASKTKFRRVNINTVIENALAISQVYAGKTNIFVTKEHNLSLKSIMGDERNLERCFCNIINNAVEAMSGEGRLSISTFMSENESNVCIKISDTGCGIDPDFSELIFEPFFTTRKYRGAHGLGLSLSYAIIIDHGGTLKVESEQGYGTVILVKIPAALADTDKTSVKPVSQKKIEPIIDVEPDKTGVEKTSQTSPIGSELVDYFN